MQTVVVGILVAGSRVLLTLRGGNPYRELIPRTARRPVRFLVQAGHGDLGHDRPVMNWLSANLRVADALRWALAPAVPMDAR